MAEMVPAHPVGGVDYPKTFQQLLAWFPDDESCLNYLADLRWPDGFVCPACESGRYWRTAKARWMCADCGRQTSVTAGTIFHRTRTPLSTWFAAVWFITSQKNGVSALGLQRVLGFGSYETAWAWMHKLRRTMVRPDRDQLSGVVELDEVFIGNETRGKAGGVKDNCAAMIAVESFPSRKLGRVRIEVADVARSTTSLMDFATRTIEKGSTIRTDGATNLRRLSTLGYQHEYFVASVPRNRHMSTSPASTWSAPYSNAGSPAPCTTPYPKSTWATTSTSTPSGSTAAPPRPADCSSTDSCNKQSKPIPTHSPPYA